MPVANPMLTLLVSEQTFLSLTFISKVPLHRVLRSTAPCIGIMSWHVSPPFLVVLDLFSFRYRAFHRNSFP